ncbi:MAG TPA: MerR family DNA-binding transcriptional regulator [Acidiphilium sp.]|nr:MerR family DNA-binding transcriptional regulator [Acidiphilium sp.]HQU22930.1 MerR family DNA-binding transcriptional regulator [Acidiphilium sp.]
MTEMALMELQNSRSARAARRDISGDSPTESGKAEALFSVSQLARQLGVTARTIRFYEDKGLLAPSRAGTTRVYTVRDRARLVLILRGKRLGFSLREIKEYLDLYDIDPTHLAQVRQLLAGVRKRIAKLHDQRAALEQSLAELADIERQAEAALAEPIFSKKTKPE